MTFNDIKSSADELRPNALSSDLKKKWLLVCESEIAEMMEEDIDWSESNPEMLLDERDQFVYIFYLCAMIDYFNNETAEYANDMAMYNNALANAKAFYRRHHVPGETTNAT